MLIAKVHQRIYTKHSAKLVLGYRNRRKPASFKVPQPASFLTGQHLSNQHFLASGMTSRAPQSENGESFPWAVDGSESGQASSYSVATPWLLKVGGPNAARTLPRLIYGTAWKEEKTADLTAKAIESGFSAIDTAAQRKHYREELVGNGIRRVLSEETSPIQERSQLFIQTKFTPGQTGEQLPYTPSDDLAKQVHDSISNSLSNFRVGNAAGYIDSLVLHSPCDSAEDTLTVWRVLEAHVPSKIHRLGISNVSLPELEALYDQATIKPEFVQNSISMRYRRFNSDVWAFCRDKGIVFQGFHTLTGNPGLHTAPTVLSLAKAAGVSVEVAIYSLFLGLDGWTILVGTTDVEHMTGDLQGVARVEKWAKANALQWDESMDWLKQYIGYV